MIARADISCFPDSGVKVVTYHAQQGISWNDARAACVDAGGDLLSIHSSAEDDHAYSLTGGDKAVWFGFNDVAQDGTWAWTDGSAVDYTNWQSPSGNDGGGGSEDHGGYWRSFGGKWADGTTSWNADGYLCQTYRGKCPLFLSLSRDGLILGIASLIRNNS